MFGWYYIPKKMSDLNVKDCSEMYALSELKDKIKILVIDDHEFTYLDSLNKREFRVKQKKDIDDLNDVAVYDVILCDIRGVGKFLNSEYEGANLIKEIKTQYPNKYLIAYTANEYDANFQYFLGYADKLVEKGSLDLEDWVAMLEQALRDITSPSKVWIRIREKLLDANVNTVDIAVYESRYVKAINEKSYKSVEQLCQDRELQGSEILMDLLQTVLVKLLKSKK